MDLKFSSEPLDRLETDSNFDNGLPKAVVRAYRKRLAILRCCVGRRDLEASRFLGMVGKAARDCLVTLADNFALHFEILDDESALMIVAIVSVESEMSI